MVDLNANYLARLMDKNLPVKPAKNHSANILAKFNSFAAEPAKKNLPVNRAKRFLTPKPAKHNSPAAQAALKTLQDKPARSLSPRKPAKRNLSAARAELNKRINSLKNNSPSRPPRHDSSAAKFKLKNLKHDLDETNSNDKSESLYFAPHKKFSTKLKSRGRPNNPNRAQNQIFRPAAPAEKKIELSFRSTPAMSLDIDFYNVESTCSKICKCIMKFLACDFD